METGTVEQDKGTVDLTDDVPLAAKVPSPQRTTSPAASSHKHASKRDMSWIEMSERGKLAAPGAKPSLSFDTTKSTPILPPKIKNPKVGKQANIKSFMADRKGPEFVHLVDDDDDGDAGPSTRSSSSKSEQSKPRTRSDSEKKRSTKDKEKRMRAAFIPQLMFDGMQATQ